MVILSKNLGFFIGHLWRVKNQISKLLAYRGKSLRVCDWRSSLQLLVYQQNQN